MTRAGDVLAAVEQQGNGPFAVASSYTFDCTAHPSGQMLIYDVDTQAALGSIQEIIAGVVESQSTIAAAVQEQTASTAEARDAMSGASREATRMAADLTEIVREA